MKEIEVYAVVSRYNFSIANGLSESDYNDFYYTTRIFHELNHSICRKYNLFDRKNVEEIKQEETFCDEFSLILIKLIYGIKFYEKIIEIYNKFNLKAENTVFANGYINFRTYKVRTLDKLFKSVEVRIKKNDFETEEYFADIEDIVEKYKTVLKKIGIEIEPTLLIIADFYDVLDRKKIISRYENMESNDFKPLYDANCINIYKEIEVR